MCVADALAALLAPLTRQNDKRSLESVAYDGPPFVARTLLTS